MVSDSAAVGAGWLRGRGEAASAPLTARLDFRRCLQLALAGIWLLDGILQYQAFMFSKGFSDMLAGTAAGNPGFIADPINWAAKIIEHHQVGTNAAFATIQLLLGIGIAVRPTVRAALAASIVWSVAVWWFGEGLGGVLNGGASPLNGAPGAVIIYALLAVLLWPAQDDEAARPPFVAARPVGLPAARVLWVLLWGSLAYFSVTAANRGAQGVHDMVAGMADGEPGWLAAINRGFAGLFAHQGLTTSVIFAVVLAAIAVGIFLPAPWHKAAIVLAIVVAAFIWVVAQDLGEILAGGATDVNSGPLLALTALAYWPLARTAAAARPLPSTEDNAS